MMDLNRSDPLGNDPIISSSPAAESDENASVQLGAIFSEDATPTT